MTENEILNYLEAYGLRARNAAAVLAVAPAGVKNAALSNAAELLVRNTERILRENQNDVETAAAKGMSVSMQDRLRLTAARIEAMAEGLLQLTAMEDPIGAILEGCKRPNGLEIIKKRVPLGVIGIIYEARPNVTADAAGLCIKSGNACILRGGSEALRSNLAIASIFKEALENAGLPGACVQLIDNTGREIASAMMRLNRYIDVLIPRGGAGLINTVVTTASVPVIQTGTGNCHIYADCDADPEMARKIIVNAKTQRPSVCNAIETILVHKDIAEAFLTQLKPRFKAVKIYGDERSLKVLDGQLATKENYGTEYDDMICNVKVVADIDEAIEHIYTYSTKHSECIVTENKENASYFMEALDSACVYQNASTRFTDGGQFGFGAEVGISTQKLHARGPIGLQEMTSTKYKIFGNGQIRK